MYMFTYVHSGTYIQYCNHLDLPNHPQFTQCITYNSGLPALRVSSYVSYPFYVLYNRFYNMYIHLYIQHCVRTVLTMPISVCLLPICVASQCTQVSLIRDHTILPMYMYR